MPRLKDETRLARREAIADAALQVFERRGVAHAAMADIIEALGGSAGGVYSHFTSKAELVRFIAARELTKGFTAITASAAAPSPPALILRAELSEMAITAPTRIIIQLWSEAMVDDEMRAVVLDTLHQVETALRQAVLPWARTQPGDPELRAERAARAMRALAQGYIVQLAIFGRPSADHYLDDLEALLTTTQ